MPYVAIFKVAEKIPKKGKKTFSWPIFIKFLGHALTPFDLPPSF